MADVYSIEKTTLDAIANSVRGQTGRTALLDPKDISAEIDSLVAGGMKVPTDTLPITANGNHDVTNYATAEVNVPQPSGDYPSTITVNGSYDVTDYETVKVNVPVPSGYYQQMYTTKTVTVDKNTKSISSFGTSGRFYPTIYVVPSLEEATITEGGEHTPSGNNLGFSKVTVPLEEKTITANNSYSPSEGYAGFSNVIVNVPIYGTAYHKYTFGDNLYYTYHIQETVGERAGGSFYPLLFYSNANTAQWYSGFTFTYEPQYEGLPYHTVYAVKRENGNLVKIHDGYHKWVNTTFKSITTISTATTPAIIPRPLSTWLDTNATGSW